MALTEKEKEKLNQLDFAAGGGFSDFLTGKKKLAPTGDKILFVGLGGKGCKTVAAIKTEVYKRIQCPAGKQRPENFEYLAIDTDSATLNQVVTGGGGQIGLSNAPEDRETCQLYDTTTAMRLRNHEFLPDNVKAWINPSMTQDLTGAGAGGVRQAGRYLLFGTTAFNAVKGQLSEKLQRLHTQVKTAKQEMIVYIFAGMGGGTGSSIIIDIPYIIREICHRLAFKVEVKSYLFLPDTYSGCVNAEYLKCNCYAALKEIDTLMNLGYMDGTASFQAIYQPDFTVSSQKGIFDSCVLVSGKQQRVGLVQNPDAYTRKVVVDNIINRVSDSKLTENTLFLAKGFLDMAPVEIQAAVAAQYSAVPRNAFYQYAVIGVGAATLPLEQMLAYLAHGTMDKMVQGWDKHADQTDVADLLTSLHATPEEIRQRINEKSTVPVLEYHKGIGGAAKTQQVQDDSLYHAIKAIWMSQNVSLFDAWDIAKNKCLEGIITALNRAYMSSFTDANQGIYFLKELIGSRVVDGARFNGLKERVQKNYKALIQGFINGQMAVKQQAEARMLEIKTELDSPIFRALKEGKLIEEYRSCCVQSLVAENWIEMYASYAEDCLDQIVVWLDKRLEELQKYIDVVTYMKELINKNYDSVMKNTLPTAEYAAAIMDFSRAENDANVKAVLTYLDNLMAEKTPAGLVTVFEAAIQADPKLWQSSEESFSPLKVFVQFIEKQYPGLSNMTLEDFLNLKYGAAGFADGMLGLCMKLEAEAGVTFPAGCILDLRQLPSQQYVLVPSQAAAVAAQVSRYTGNSAIVAQGEDQNSIYWYNLIIGVPLFAWADINAYEASYENCSRVGLHIQETEEDNWKDLPALSNQKIWSSPDFNPREKAFAEQVQKDVAAYLACGLIENTGLSYVAHCLPQEEEESTIESILEWCRAYRMLPVRKENGEVEMGKPFFDMLLNANKFTTYQVQMPIVYMETIDDTNLHELVRMNLFLYRKLQKTYVVCEQCVRMLQEAFPRHS